MLGLEAKGKATRNWEEEPDFSLCRVPGNYEKSRCHSPQRQTFLSFPLRKKYPCITGLGCFDARYGSLRKVHSFDIGLP